jgi:5-formyltetrahydrofolate cyclo-ligase
MSMEKAALRRHLVETIDTLPETYIEESNEGLFNVLITIPEYIASKTVFVYHSIMREPDTIRFINHSLTVGKTVALPVCFKGGVMEARVVAGLDGLERTKYGLLEPLSSMTVLPPEGLDFIIVPALTYDRDGFRIGWGGGFYDRYLPRTVGFTCGVARERLLTEHVPREAHDVPVRCVATEKEARLLSGASREA